MDRNRERLVLQIQQDVRSGRYRLDLDALTRAVFDDLATPPHGDGFCAAILLQDRAERALVHLGLAERGISSACFDPAAPLDELACYAPGLIVAAADSGPAAADLRRAFADARLLLVGGSGEGPEMLLPRSLTLQTIRAALDAVAPSRLTRRRFARVLVVEEEMALLREIRSSGCEAVCVADPRRLFIRPPRGPFDLVFLGPALAAHLDARTALARIYGPDLNLCSI